MDEIGLYQHLKLDGFHNISENDKLGKMVHAKLSNEIIGNKKKIDDMHDIIPYGSKWLIWSIDMDEDFHMDEIDNVEWYDYMNKID